MLAGKCLKRWSNDAVLSGKSVPPQFFLPLPLPLQIKLGGPIAVNCSEKFVNQDISSEACTKNKFNNSVKEPEEAGLIRSVPGKTN